MSDIKKTIALLCEHIEQCTGIKVKPEYYRIAKYNEESLEAVECFWSILNVLSFFAVKNIQADIDLQHYDKYKSSKIYLAFLQYPGMEFYGLLENDPATSREILLALAWLIGIHNALETAMRFKLIESSLGREYSHVDDPLERIGSKLSEKEDPLELSDEINSIIHKCTRISNNFKEITELMNEKLKLTTKAHAATLTTCGLPHLHVSEMSIIKRYFINRNKFSREDGEFREELQSAGSMIESHMKWQKNEKLFFDWMETVLEEHKANKSGEPSEKNLDEFLKFITIIRHLVKKKISALKQKDETNENLSKIPCTSRFSRNQEKDEAKLWNSEITKKLNEEQISVSERTKLITEELKILLKAIPNCIQI